MCSLPKHIMNIDARSSFNSLIIMMFDVHYPVLGFNFDPNDYAILFECVLCSRLSS